MNLYFIYTGSTGFPLGDAYTNRILSLAKGLRQVGCCITILIIYPGRKLGVKEARGEFDQIPYRYMSSFNIPGSFLQRKWMGIWGINKAFNIEKYLYIF